MHCISTTLDNRVEVSAKATNFNTQQRTITVNNFDIEINLFFIFGDVYYSFSILNSPFSILNSPFSIFHFPFIRCYSILCYVFFDYYL